MGITASHKLREVRIVGGFLDGVVYEFSDNLNCIIGARGTGKTSVLELIRYALNAMPSDSTSRRKIESLVEHNLNGGRIEVKIETRDGLDYIISRNVGDQPIVLDANKCATGLNFSSSIFRLDVFSQNEVENIAEQSASQLELLETFDQERLFELNSQIQQVRTALQANATEIQPLRQQFTELQDRVNTLPALEDKLKTYATVGSKDAKLLNTAHEQKAMRDREHSLTQALSSAYDSSIKTIETLGNLINQQVQWRQTNDLGSGANGSLIGELFAELESCNSEVNVQMKNILGFIGQSRERFAEIAGRINLVHQQQDVAFQSLMEQHREEQSKSAERIKLERQRNELLSFQSKMQEIMTKGKLLAEERQTMLAQLSDLRDRRFTLRHAIVGLINDALAPAIRTSIIQYGGQEEYCALLIKGLKNAGIQHRTVAARIAAHCHPSELSEMIKNGVKEDLLLKVGLNQNQANAVIDKLDNPQFIAELEIVELADLPVIELNDHGCYKTTEMLSTGQKCNTILPILLLDSDRPLLIDQPEDNLDNGFVHNTIVDSIMTVKKKRQLVFVTHNPNIPVLADAERLLVLESDGKRGHVRQIGNVDECKSDIVSLLEGGEAAFKKRKIRYQY